jgi:signal transduction histidine kinase
MKFFWIYLFFILFVVSKPSIFAQQQSLNNQLNIDIEKENFDSLYYSELEKRIMQEKLFEEENSKNFIYVSIISVFALISLFMAFVFYRSKQKQVALNAKLNNLGKEILAQAQEVREVNMTLTDSNEEILQQREEITAQAESLQDTLRQLRELNEFKDGMTAMIVHDLKNPLTLIMNLGKDELLVESGRRMLNMINNILDVNRFETVDVQLKKQQISLGNLVHSSYLNTKFLIDQKSIHFIDNVAEGVDLFVDDELIERVFINLISNAVKYTPNEGSITIDAKVNSSQSIKISVTDTGPGIPENLKDRIFDKFTQIIAKKSGNTRSHGLGLTFCKYAIEAHQGVIGVDTKIGEGTSFWFTLPYQSENYIEEEKEVVAVQEKVRINASIVEKIFPYIENLRQKDAFEVSEIQRIIDEIRGLGIYEIDNWLKALENSVYSVNQKEFSELLSQFS